MFGKIHQNTVDLTLRTTVLFSRNHSLEIYAQPYVKAEGKGEHTYYGHGLWIYEAKGRKREAYITGCDAGVSFRSSVDRDNDLQVTVISNTTYGAWPILKDIDTAMKALSGRTI